MAEPDVDIGQLSESQQSALRTYTSVTNQDSSAARRILERSQWNVQIAITKFFDGDNPDPFPALDSSAANAESSAAHHVSNLQEEMSMSSRASSPVKVLAAPRIVPQPIHQIAQRPPLLISLLLAPMSLFYRFFSFAYTLFSRLFPFLPRFVASVRRTSTLNHTPTRRPLNPKDTALRFIREFEEEFRPNPPDSIPFYENGYAQALDLSKSTLKFLLVILLSPEHDDTGPFVASTLLSSLVTSFLNNPPPPGLVIWAGSLLDPEAYQLSIALHATTAPFAALIAHTPQVSSTAMSVILRIAGPTNADTFVAKLRSAMATHAPALEHVRTQRAEQAAARSLREEQNSAYERSLARDRERTRRRKEEEEARVAAEKAAFEKQRLQEELQIKRELWRRWRASKILAEPENGQETVRLSIRMADGERIIRKFDGTAPLEEVYALVECHDILDRDDEKSEIEKPEDYEHEYAFRLVSPMPRTVYDVRSADSISKAIGRGANLLVEMVEDEDEDAADGTNV